MIREYKYGQQDLQNYRAVVTTDEVVTVCYITSMHEASLLSPVLCERINDLPPICIHTDEHSGKLTRVNVWVDESHFDEEVDEEDDAEEGCP